MQLQLESTTKTVELDGVPARVWEGTTASGIPVIAFVTRVMVRANEDCAEFEAELKECRVPSDAVQHLPLKLLL